MKAIISADDLAKDVAGAEALLDRHQEHKVNLLELPLYKRLFYCRRQRALYQALTCHIYHA